MSWRIYFLFLLSTTLLLTSCAHLSPQEERLRALKHENPNVEFVDSKTGSHEVNVWRGLYRQFQLEDCSTQPQVTEQIAWYSAHPNYLVRSASRGSPFIYYIASTLKERNLPGELALLPIVESAYNPYAYSRSGAAGLWQFLPATAISYSLPSSWWYDGRRDVMSSTQAALDYLTYLHQYFNGDWLLAIAAYNGGEGYVQAAINQNAARNLPTDFWSLSLRSETRTYVPKLLALACMLSHQKKYPIAWPNTPERVYLAAVPVSAQMDLTEAAKQAGLSMTEFYALNPGFNRSASDPNSESTIVLPIDKLEQFQTAMAEQLKMNDIHYETYDVKKHDTLNKIALFFHTTLAKLRQNNHLSNDTLALHQKLAVPVGKTLITPNATLPNVLLMSHGTLPPLTDPTQ